MKGQDVQRLRVSVDGRRLEREDGSPFFFLADTAWTLPQRLKWDDALEYMSRRRMQGFTALQIVALDPERDIDIRTLAGERALLRDDPRTPNEHYFRYLDWVISAAEAFGLYVVLVPVWGQLVVGESWSGKTFPRTITAENARDLGEWFGARYRDRPNIIWCLGGDRQPIHKGVDHRAVWRRMAEGLLTGVTGAVKRHDEPDPAWRELLITYHTCYERETGEFSTMSYWTDEEAWLSLIMLQSGHGLHTTNYDVVAKEYGRSRVMPIIDAEPAYERMPMNWPVLYPLHDDWIVRKRAYWSLLAGSCGHTYGHASVWCMVSEKERNEVLDATWFEALSAPGAEQMKVLRDLVESTSATSWVPAQEMIGHLCAVDCTDAHRQAARDRDGGFALVYLSDGGAERVDVSALSGAELYASWFSPRDGSRIDLHGRETDDPSRVDETEGFVEFTAPSSGAGEDWLLLIAADADWIRGAGSPRVWGQPVAQIEMSMIWD